MGDNVSKCGGGKHTSECYISIGECGIGLCFEERPAAMAQAQPLPSGYEEWSLTFYGSPPSVMVRAGSPGLPDSRRDIAFMEFASREERAEKGAALSAMVDEHNSAITTFLSKLAEVERALEASREVGSDYAIEVAELKLKLKEAERERPLTDEQIKHMANRFLCWRLPEDFHPDAGISFKPTFNDHLPAPTKHNPTGTNLFDATQAEAMVRYMIEGLRP